MHPDRDKQARPSRRYISLPEAAEYLGVCERTVRRLIASGDLNGYRVAGRRTIRVDVADVDAIMTPIPSAAVGVMVATATVGVVIAMLGLTWANAVAGGFAVHRPERRRPPFDVQAVRRRRQVAHELDAILKVHRFREQRGGRSA